MYGNTNGATNGVDQAFLSPITPVGAVLFNGAIAQGALISAMQNKSAKYPLPSGQSLELVGRVRKADVVYRFIDEHEYNEPSHGRNNNTQVSALSSINGQGFVGESEASFLSRIQVLGIADMENDMNGSQLFNIQCGGIYTIMNVSNQDISTGDWLMVYAPRLDEVREGGRGLEADNNGLMTLWLVPYHPEIHQSTPAHVFTCLSRMNEGLGIHSTIDGKSFMPEYESMCNSQFDAFMGSGMIFLEFLRKRGLVKFETAQNVTPANLYAALFERLGHTRFYNEKRQDPEMRQELLNALFLQRLSRKTDDYEAANYFPTNEENQRKLRQCQLETIDIGLSSQSRLIHNITKNILGKAITPMRPKGNGSFQMCSYIGAK